MSHYTRGGVQIDDQGCFIMALEELGFHPEYHEQAERLRGYQGDLREERAHVILRRAEVGTASNDIGFFFHPGGKCEAIISEYDSGRYNAEWLGKVKQLTAKHVALNKARSLGHRATATVDDKGRVRIKIQGNL